MSLVYSHCPHDVGFKCLFSCKPQTIKLTLLLSYFIGSHYSIIVHLQFQRGEIFSHVLNTSIYRTIILVLCGFGNTCCSHSHAFNQSQLFPFVHWFFFPVRAHLFSPNFQQVTDLLYIICYVYNAWPKNKSAH